MPPGTNDYVIRVILEGKDFLSGILNRAAQRYNRDTNLIRNSTAALSDELDDFAKELDKLEKLFSGKVTSAKQGKTAFSRFLGINENDVDYWENRIRRIRRVLTGEITPARVGRKNFAAYLGIDEGDVNRVYSNLRNLRRFLEEFQSGELTRPRARGEAAPRSILNLLGFTNAQEAKAGVRKIAAELQQEWANTFGFGGKQKKELPQWIRESRAGWAGPLQLPRLGEESQKQFDELKKAAEKGWIDLTQVFRKPIEANVDYTDLFKGLEKVEKRFLTFRKNFKGFFQGLAPGANERQFLLQEIKRLEQGVETAGQKIRRYTGVDQGRVRYWTYRLQDLDETLKTTRTRLKEIDNIGYRVGSRIRTWIDGVNKLANVRWLLLVAVVAILGKALLSVGAALLEVGASAVQAATALGGAFVAAVLQAIAVVGLLQAAFARVSKVADLAAQQDKLRIRSSTDAEAQAKAEKQAQEALAEALESQTDAIKGLASARKQASRNLVDSALDEKDANLSLREAELGVIEAKERLLKLQREQNQDAQSLDYLKGQVEEAQRRLALAKQQGQEAEISAASQQLSIAQQNLSAFLDQAQDTATELKQGQLAAERAALNLREARIRARRAKEDNKETQAKGVEGSDEVVAALKQVENATKAVAKARTDLVEATDKQTAAQKQLEDELSDLSGAERGLFKTLVNLRERFRVVFRPVTDIIVSAVDRGIQRASALLDDPKIIGAARGLASQLGISIGKISAFTVSPEVREAITFFIREARKNLPLVTDALINIAKAFLRIGEAASPLFRELLERFTGLTGRFERFTRNQKRLDEFFQGARKYVNTWIRLGKAIAAVLYELTRTAGPSGNTLLDNFSKALESLAKFLKDNETAAKAFFEEQRKNVEDFSKVLFTLGRALFEAFNNSDLTEFVALFAELLIPSFELALKLLDLMSAALLAIAKIPFAEEALKFVFAWGIIRRLFPILGNLDKLLLKIFDEQNAINKAARALWPRFIGFATTTKDRLFALASNVLPQVVAGIQKLTKAIREATVAQKLFNYAARANIWVIIASLILALGAALVALEYKTHRVSKAFNDLKATLGGWVNAIASIPRDLYNLGRDMAQGIIDGFKSKATEWRDSVINWIMSPWGWVKSQLGIDSPSRWTYENIGVPLAQGVVSGATDELRQLGPKAGAELARQLDYLQRQAKVRANTLLGQLTTFKGAVSDALSLRLEAQTPAEKEMQALEEAEAKRNRQKSIQSANENVSSAEKEAKRANAALIKAKKAYANASTKEDKQMRKAELDSAKQANDYAQQTLKDAQEQREETLHQAWVDEQRERLAKQAETERKSLEQSVEAEQKKADKLFAALKKALNNQNWNQVAKIFDKIVDLVGWEALGEVGAAGFLKGFQKKIDAGIANVTKQAQIKAQQNLAAKKVLGASAQTRGAAAQIGAGPHGGKGITAKDKLETLVALGQIDKATAISIVRNILSTSQAADVLYYLMNDKSGGGVFGRSGVSGDSIAVRDAINAYTKKNKSLSAKQKLLKLLKDGKLSYGAEILSEKEFLEFFIKALQNIQLFAAGGQVSGTSGQPVPIIAHAGEWVLNKEQQAKASARMGTSLAGAKSYLFGGKQDGGMSFAKGGVVGPIDVGPISQMYAFGEILKLIKQNIIAPLTANKMFNLLGMPTFFKKPPGDKNYEAPPAGRGGSSYAAGKLYEWRQAFWPQTATEGLNDTKFGQLVAKILAPEPEPVGTFLNKVVSFVTGVDPKVAFQRLKTVKGPGTSFLFQGLVDDIQNQAKKNKEAEKLLRDRVPLSDKRWQKFINIGIAPPFVWRTPGTGWQFRPRNPKFKAISSRLNTDLEYREAIVQKTVSQFEKYLDTIDFFEKEGALKVSEVAKSKLRADSKRTLEGSTLGEIETYIKLLKGNVSELNFDAPWQRSIWRSALTYTVPKNRINEIYRELIKKSKLSLGRKRPEEIYFSNKNAYEALIEILSGENGLHISERQASIRLNSALEALGIKEMGYFGVHKAAPPKGTIYGEHLGKNTLKTLDPNQTGLREVWKLIGKELEFNAHDIQSMLNEVANAPMSAGVPGSNKLYATVFSNRLFGRKVKTLPPNLGSLAATNRANKSLAKALQKFGFKMDIPQVAYGKALLDDEIGYRLTAWKHIMKSRFTHPGEYELARTFANKIEDYVREGKYKDAYSFIKAHQRNTNSKFNYFLAGSSAHPEATSQMAVIKGALNDVILDPGFFRGFSSPKAAAKATKAEKTAPEGFPIGKNVGRTKAGDRLLQRLMENHPEVVKTLWASDPRDAIATQLNLNNAPRLATIQSARRAAYEITQEYLRKYSPAKGGLTLWRGGQLESDMRSALVAFSPEHREAWHFSKGSAGARDMRELRVLENVPIEDVEVSLKALHRHFSAVSGRRIPFPLEDEYWILRSKLQSKLKAYNQLVTGDKWMESFPDAKAAQEFWTATSRKLGLKRMDWAGKQRAWSLDKEGQIRFELRGSGPVSQASRFYDIPEVDEIIKNLEDALIEKYLKPGYNPANPGLARQWGVIGHQLRSGYQFAYMRAYKNIEKALESGGYRLPYTYATKGWEIFEDTSEELLSHMRNSNYDLKSLIHEASISKDFPHANRLPELIKAEKSMRLFIDKLNEMLPVASVSMKTHADWAKIRSYILRQRKTKWFETVTEFPPPFKSSIRNIKNSMFELQDLMYAADLEKFDAGGTINGAEGKPVPIIAHAGEWVLNKMQQNKLAKKLAVPVDRLKKFLFGAKEEPITNQQLKSQPFNPRIGQSRKYDTFELARVPDDGYGNPLYFVEFDDGAYGQVNKREADRIVKTGGQWVPARIRRSRHAFTASYLSVPDWAYKIGKKKKGSGGGPFALAKGGEILASMATAASYNPSVINSYVQSYAAGGVVTAAPDGIQSGAAVTKTVNQNFNVHTEGETDWNYVMRLGGIHAMG